MNVKTLAACAFALAAAPAFANVNPSGLDFAAGNYRCDLNRTVKVLQVAADFTSAVLNWDKKEYRLTAKPTQSGALRYEDAAGSGLVWIVIHGKSMLLDTKAGRQLANDCKV